LRPNCQINWTIIRSSFIWCIIWSGTFSLNAAEVQLQFSTYYDSNARESPTSSDSTFGLTVRGRLSEVVRLSRVSLSGDIFAHSYLDAHDYYENKVVFNGDLGLRYSLSNSLQIRGQFQHFLKSFLHTTGSYEWTLYSTTLQYSHRSGYAVWLSYLHRSKLLEGMDQYRFVEESLELNHRYHFNTRWLVEGSLLLSDLTHTDFSALDVSEDTTLISLGIPQKDRGFGGLVHFRYRGRAIIGSRIGVRTVRSNSVIGDYNLRLFQVYLSGNLGQSTYYHIIYRLVEKDYQYPQLEGVSWYRDPEEHDQNLTHLRLERMISDNGILYMQLSFLRNETILNHQYYSKTMIEIGLKYEL
jgi:hypothetical protein